MNKPEMIIRELLDSAQIAVNGSNPWDIQVHNERFYERVLRDASLGLGEAYMDGWWDCDAIDAFIDRVLRANLRKKVEKNIRLAWHVLRAKLFNRQSLARSPRGGSTALRPRQ
jgi:cyclopropane-fatty-acyl-phospholipid synthase